MQGTQIRVVDGRDATAGAEEPPVSDATAFRLRQGTTHNAQPFSAGSGGIALSNVLGFVQTPSELYPGDSVAAIWPVTATATITAHTPLRRYVVTAPVRVPPGPTIASTQTIADMRRIGALALTVGLVHPPTANLAIALVDPAGAEILLVESTAALNPRSLAALTTTAESHRTDPALQPDD